MPEEEVFETRNVQLYVEKLKNIKQIRENLIDMKERLKDVELGAHTELSVDPNVKYKPHSTQFPTQKSLYKHSS